MNAIDALGALARATALLTAGALCVELVIWALRVRAPRWRRAGWATVLLLGVAGLPLELRLPWLPAPPVERASPAGLPVTPTRREPAAAHLTLAPPPATRAAESKPMIPTPTISEPRREAAIHDWPLVVVAVWIVGMAARAGWLGWSYWRFSSALRQLATPAERGWRDDYDAVLAERRLRRAPPLLAAPGAGPLVWQGLRGAALVVPSLSAATFRAAERRAILQHELAHWRRGDLWTGLLAQLLALPHWFNPAAAWAVRRFEEAAEWICDDAAREEQAAPSLAEALLRLGSGAGPALTPSAARRSRLGRRIERLTQPLPPKEPIMKRCAICLALAALLLAAAVRVELVAQEPDGGAAAEASGAQAPAPEAPEEQEIPREDLRYDGHDFDYWSTQAVSDLSPEVLGKTLMAMQLFGKRGYADEAVDAVLTICEVYPHGFPRPDVSNPYAAFPRPTDVLRELAPLAAERLALQLDSKSKTRRQKAAAALENAGPALKPLVPRLIRGLSDPELKWPCLRALGAAAAHDERAANEILRIIQTNDEMAVAAFQAARWPEKDDRLDKAMLEFLKRASVDQRLAVLRNANTIMLDSPPNEVAIPVVLLDDPDEGVRERASDMIAGWTSGQFPAIQKIVVANPQLVPQLIRALARGGKPAGRAVRLLARVAPDDPAVEQLLRELAKPIDSPNEDPTDVQIAAHEALNKPQKPRGADAAVRAAADKALQSLKSD